MADSKRKQHRLYISWRTNKGDRCFVKTSLLSKHLFVARWQNEEYKKLFRNVPKQTVVAVLNFAKNYWCEYQEEPQAAHWCYKQVTIHPIVCNYRCSDCDGIVTEEIVCVTPDLKHSAAAVKVFEQQAYKHLREERKVDFNNMYEFTDRCSSQYKSREPFFHLSAQTIVRRSFFGSRHGKGPADGLAGVIKAAAKRAVASGRTNILNALDFYNFAQKDLEKLPAGCNHVARKFFYILEIVTEDLPVLQTVKDTRKIQEMQPSSAPGYIDFRNLSCFCTSRLNGEENCVSQDWVSKWKHSKVARCILYFKLIYLLENRRIKFA